jgi:tetratricopeptide (TPR) repeat protein
MGTGSPGEGGAALRALRSAAPEIAALRHGPWDDPETRGRILRVSNAIDRSLRRLLRDDDEADLEVRLRALAPDEMSPEAVLGELRRNERLSMDVAAGVHELFGTRRQLEQGAEAGEREALRAVRIADRLEREIEGRTMRQPPVAEPGFARDAAAATPFSDEELFPPAPRSRRRKEGPGRRLAVIAAAATLVLLVIAVGLWFRADRGPNHMEQGIALFRSGAFSEAAHHFWRHSEANPRDATPHLYLARIHRRMNRPDLAADALREAQRLDPEDPALHRELGFLLLDTGQPATAVDRFRQAVERDPESSEGYIGLVRALRESGRAADAARVIAEAPPEVRALLGGE